MIGASDAVRGVARQVGLRGIHIGDEAVVPIATFRLDTPAMRNVRQAVQRTRNAGVTVSVHLETALDEALRGELGAVADEWRRGRGERGFAMTMDHLLEHVYPGALIFVGSHKRRPVGYQRSLLSRGGATLSLDVMPRRRGAPNGLNERLIVEAVHWGATHGVHEVSLNFAAFRNLFEAEASPSRQVLRWIAHRLDVFINVESLYRFNAKFHPVRIPRHVLFHKARDIPAVLAASLRAEFEASPARSSTTTRPTLRGDQRAHPLNDSG